MNRTLLTVIAFLSLQISKLKKVLLQFSPIEKENYFWFSTQISVKRAGASKAFGFLLVLLFVCSATNAATYYSKVTTGNFAAPGSWSTSPTGTPTNATALANGDSFIIQNGHTITVTANIRMSNITVQTGGVLIVGGFDFRVDNLTSISGTLTHNNTAGTKSYRGLVTINTGGFWNNSGNSTIEFRAGITNNGTFSAGTGVQTFNTSAQGLLGNLTIPSVTVTGVTLTNNGNLYVSTALSGTGAITNASPALNTLVIQGTSSIAAITNNATAIIENSGAITTAAFTNTGLLHLNGSGAITTITNNAGGVVNLNNSGTITTFNNATATSVLNINDLTVPTITTFTTIAAGNTVNYSGADNQTIRANTYSNLTLSNYGTKTFSGTTTVGSELSIASGIIANLGTGLTHTANILTLGGAPTSTGSWGSTTSAAANKNNTYFSAVTGIVNVSNTNCTITSNAGTDQSANSSSFVLAANALTGGSTGAWTIANGPNTATSQFSSTTSPTATFTPTIAGTYVLTWTVTNGFCIVSDQVVIANKCESNLILNGDFANSSAGNNNAANWTAATTLGSYVETNPEDTYFASGNNDFTAELDSEASLRQVVTVIPGVSYTVSFLFARRADGNNPTTRGVTVKITGGTSDIISSGYTSSSNTPQRVSFDFTPTSSSIGVEFYNTLNAGSTLGTIIDDIVLVPTSQLSPFATTVPKGNYKTYASCAGLPVQLNVENVPASGVTYAWTGTSGAVFSPSANIINPTITFAGSGVQQATVVATSSNGCPSSQSTTYVNVSAAPTVTSTTGNSKIYTRTANTTTVSAVASSGATIDWYNASSGGTLLSSGSLTYVPTGVNAGTYTVYAQARNTTTGCVSTSRTAVTLTITPKALTITGAVTSNKVYDGTVTASVTAGTLSGVISPDAVTLTLSGTFATKNVGTGIVITSTSTLGGADAGNYTLTQPTLTARNITAKALTITGATTVDKVYDGTTTASVTGGSLVGVVSPDVVTLTQSGTFATKNVGTGIAITSTSTIGGADASNYTLTQPTLTARNITAKALTITGATTADKVYDGTTTASVTGGSLVGVVSPDVVTLTLSGTFATKNVGTGIVITSTSTLGGANAGNYTLTQPTLTARNITAKALTITGATTADKVYDGTTTASVTGGSLVGVVSPDVVTLTLSGTFATKNVGTGIVITSTSTLGGADAGNYTLTQPTLTARNITAKTLTITGATTADKVYDGTTTASVTGGSLVGVVSPDVVTLTLSGTFATKNVGTGIVITSTSTIGGADAGNYTLTQPTLTARNITAKALTITGATTADKVYDGTTTASVTGGSLVGVVSPDVVTLTLSGTFATKNVGTGIVITSTSTIGGADAGNYTLTQPTLTARNITAKALTITGATTADKVYDGTTTASVTGGSLVGVVSPDVVTLTLSGTFATKNVGTGIAITSTSTIGGADASNYTLTQPTLTARNITAKTLTITGATTADKVYDGTTTASVTGGSLVGVVSPDVVTLTLSGTFATKNVGTGIVITSTSTLGGANAGNYTLTQPTLTARNITAKTLTITGATTADKVYDGTTTASVTGGSLVGVVSPDVVTLTLSGTFAIKNVGTGIVITSTSTLGGADAGNYTLTQPTLTARNITAKTLTITGATTADKVYDGTTTASVTGGSLVGVVSPDVVTLTLSGTFATKNVGTGIVITSTSTIGGADAGNYTLTQPTLTARNITAKALTITGATTADKVYDGTTTASVTGGSLVGVVSPDVVTLTLSGTFATKNVGTGIVITSTSTLGGANAGNYTLTQPTLTARNITAKALTITGAVVTTKIYDGNTSASITGAVLSGVLAVDFGNVTLGNATTGTFSDANAGVGKAVTTAPMTISGTASGNYTLTQPALTGTINKAAITITASNRSKCYGTALTLGTTAFTASGLQNGETITSVTLASTGGYDASTTQAAGLYTGDIVPSNPSGAGFSTSNYTITMVNGNLTINGLPNNITNGFSATTICAGGSPQLTYDAEDSTFTAPYSITYQNNTTLIQYTVSIPSASAFSFTPGDNPTVNTGYSLVSISNATCTRTASFADSGANLIVRPIPTAGISGTAAVCVGTSSPNITFTNPQSVSITVTYTVNGGADQTVDIGVGASNTSSLAVSTATAGSFAYSLKSVVYQDNPTCSNTITGQSATVTVNALPSITVQPSGSNVCESDNASFTVAGSGAGLTYQWQLSTNGGGTFNNLSNGGVYSNVTAATMNITTAAIGMDTYQYRCVISGTCTPSVTSNAVTLSVNSDSGDISLNGISYASNATAFYCPSTTAIFSIPAVAGAAGYTWIVPSDWTVLSGQGTTVITVKTGTSLLREIVSVKADNLSCWSFLGVTLNTAAPAAPTVSVTAPTCAVPTGTIEVVSPVLGTSYTLTGINPVRAAVTNTNGKFAFLAAGEYAVTSQAGAACVSESVSATIQSLVTKTWNGSWSPAGVPSINDHVIFDADYSLPVSVNSCSCVVNSGANVTIGDGLVLNITNGLNVQGTLTFNNNASLVQFDDNAVNHGSITYNRTTPYLKDLDYEYWSSPVAGQKLNDLWVSDRYFRYTNGAWEAQAGTTTMDVGRGYIIRVRTGSPFEQKVKFIGEPNNGIKTIAAQGAGKSNLIGNPYPSAIDAEAFMTDPNNSIIYGGLYFWTHFTARKVDNTGTKFIYDADDYAVFTLLGSSAPLSNATGPIPVGKIAAGQSFFVISDQSGYFTFNNSMRFDIDNGGIVNNTQFFKQSNTKKTAKIQKDRVWLNLTNDGGAFKQLLVGYATGATNDFDKLYDAVTRNGNAFIDFYSVNNSKNYTIQARSLPFDKADEVPLGYKTTIEGTFQIGINNVDGGLANQTIYLEDKLTNTIHDLKTGSYSFTTAIGTFNDRFVLRYTNTSKLGTGDTVTKNKGVFVSVRNREIKVNSFDQTISSVKVYDLKGSLLYDKNKVNKNEFIVDTLNAADQVMIVMIELEDGTRISEEIIFHE
ncbi:beta strand repeat-containing protein [Flavobacterium marginilacus]|uniref:beta strand repeat-containing protein n=1 Tax=Flavobacterium marginilacus TaxID=3003256 RepID=UPI00248DD2BB|nr:YDG domain-containing protein [Flavobacterium marginilacus]